MPSIPAPIDGPNMHKITDEGISQYIEFPEDTIFMESAATDDKFLPGKAIIPIQRFVQGKGLQSFVYEIEPGVKEPKLLFGPLAAPDGDTEIRVFGSELTSTGILYLCVFNRNSVLVYDMKNPPSVDDSQAMALFEIEDLPTPNDVCVDPENESKLYVIGGTFRKAFTFICCATFSNPAFGKVYAVNVDIDSKSATTSVYKEGFDILAGVEVIDNKVWVAQLYDVFTIEQDSQRQVNVVWDGEDGQGQVWMADNICTFNENYVLFPAYSAVSERMAGFMKSNSMSSAYYFFLQMQSKKMDDEGFRDAISDPDYNISLQNTYIKEGEDPQPIRIAICTADGTKGYHFQIDLKEARANNEPREIKDPETGEVLGKRHYFNEQVTHTSHLKTADGSAGYLLCINFEQPRVLLLNDEKFKAALE